MTDNTTDVTERLDTLLTQGFQPSASIAAEALTLLKQQAARIAELEAAFEIPDYAMPPCEQEWAKGTPEVAWHLIHRHGENWPHIGQLMEAWRAAANARDGILYTMDQMRDHAEAFYLSRLKVLAAEKEAYERHAITDFPDYTFLVSSQDPLNELCPLEVLHGRALDDSDIEPCQRRILEYPPAKRYEMVSLLWKLEQTDRQA